MPACARTRIISSRPDFANWSGKNPRFAMMSPIVIFCRDISSPGRTLHTRLARSAFSVRCKMPAVERAQQCQQRSPPHTGVEMIEHNSRLRRRRLNEFVHPSTEDNHAIHQQGEADKKPYRNRKSCLHAIYLYQKTI